MNETLYDHLAFLYGDGRAAALHDRLQTLMRRYRDHLPTVSGEQAALSEKDAILITYGDQVRAPGEAPLRVLGRFLARWVAETISAVHLLPFYPYSSDDGFAVIDYKAVDPALGSWGDVAALDEHFQLMFDAVINHISAESEWFQRFLADDPQYRDYFTVVDPDTDLSAVFRPRALPLLTPVETAVGRKHVWTTFSDDQIDLNYRNPDVLLDVIDTLLFYVARGADFIRLDAIAFMWKEIGASCIHLPQTHRIIQLMRAVLDEAAPHVKLITETNVPHAENVSYFGDGANEAQMVYNFSLPPLTLHAFQAENAETLSRWAAGLHTPSGQTTFFNFLASHDGIGLTPARGILGEAEITAMAERVQALGGYVSFKNNPDGSQSAYELNVNYLDALGDPAAVEEPALIARRFLTSQAIMLALRGVPGVYFHSLFGSRGWPEGVAATGRYRTVNRQKLTRQALETELSRPGSLRGRVFSGYQELLRARMTTPAFHPAGAQRVLDLGPAIFALWRGSPDGRSQALCLHNVSGAAQTATLDPAALDIPATGWRNLVGETAVSPQTPLQTLTLPPYAAIWLRRDD